MLHQPIGDLYCNIASQYSNKSKPEKNKHKNNDANDEAAAVATLTDAAAPVIGGNVALS